MKEKSKKRKGKGKFDRKKEDGKNAKIYPHCPDVLYVKFTNHRPTNHQLTDHRPLTLRSNNH